MSVCQIHFYDNRTYLFFSQLRNISFNQRCIEHCTIQSSYILSLYIVMINNIMAQWPLNNLATIYIQYKETQ
jgi:hypothetical protein